MGSTVPRAQDTFRLLGILPGGEGSGQHFVLGPRGCSFGSLSHLFFPAPGQNQNWHGVSHLKLLSLFFSPLSVQFQAPAGVPSHLLPESLRALKLKVLGATTSSTTEGRVGVKKFRARVAPSPGLRHGVLDPLDSAPQHLNGDAFLLLTGTPL